MGRLRKDYTGIRFGEMVAISFIDYDKARNPLWLFKCDCGKEKIIRVSKAISRETSSCGCKMGNHKHGETKNGNHERLYDTWIGMKQRCNNVSTKSFVNYGERGIRVCDEWKDYPAFKIWALANGYSDILTIDRVENDGNYEPSNCQWLTRGENTAKRWVE